MLSNSYDISFWGMCIKNFTYMQYKYIEYTYVDRLPNEVCARSPKDTTDDSQYAHYQKEPTLQNTQSKYFHHIVKLVLGV